MRVVLTIILVVKKIGDPVIFIDVGDSFDLFYLNIFVFNNYTKYSIFYAQG